MIFSSWRKNWIYKPGLRLVRLTDDWKYIADIPLTHGGNGNGKTVQKNWQPFEHDGRLHFIYLHDPWEVVCGDKIYRAKGLKWDYGIIRGGTPPILIDGRYYTFFHSRLDHSRARYYMGAACFEGEAPFKPISMTMHPLLTGTNKEFNHSWTPLCVFPCGSIYRDGKFVVSFGVNDTNCALVDYEMDELLSLLRPI